MSQIDFTIAVMIYNVEKFLPMCIESIMEQSGDDIEILLVNDGSTDTCAKICDEYALKDERIHVIHKNNAGVSSARNIAIDCAKGKWLIQVDGDDILLPGSVERARKYLHRDADLLQFDAVEFIDNVSTDDWKPKGKEIEVEGKLLKEYHLQLIDRSNVKTVFPTYNLNPAWSKIWNLDFIRKNNLHYDESVVKGEGTLFTFTASYYFKKVIIIPEPIYGYRINPFSIMRRFSEDILENQNVQYNAYQKVFEQHNELQRREIREALLKRGLYLIENAINFGIAHPDCPWEKEKCMNWCEALCKLDWVQASAKYAQSANISNKIFAVIVKQDYEMLYKKCANLRKKILIRRIIKSLLKRRCR